MSAFKTYIIHVKGQEKRKKHIENELKRFSLDYEFILDGNITDLTTSRLDAYFGDNMHKLGAPTSCAIKHFFAYENALFDNERRILILEDDIVLKPNFENILHKIFLEIDQRGLSNYLISLENTNHKYVKKSEAINNQILYKKKSGRCTGAYLIDDLCAQTMLNEVAANKCRVPIDWFHYELSLANKLNIYWSHPHIAEQASHNGALGSLIDDKKKGWFRRLIYFLQGEIKKRWAPIYE